MGRGQDSDMLRFTLGSAYYKEKRFTEAIVHLTRAVEQNPTYSTAWKVLGRVFADDGQFQEALRAFQSGLLAARKNGDKQVEKEIGVFQKRAQKQLDAIDQSNAQQQPPVL